MSDKVTLNILKAVVFLLIAIITIICGFLPLTWKKLDSPKFITLANCFAGGIFLGVTFFHVLPECIETFHDQLDDKSDVIKNFPFPFLLSTFIMLIVLFVEKIAFSAHDMLHHGAGGHDHHDHHHHEEKERLQIKEIPEEENNLEQNLVNNKRNSQEMPVAKLKNVSFEGSGEITQTKTANPYEPYFLMFALTFHSFFEGIAVGIQDDTKKFINIVLAVVLHKWAVALTLGLSFVVNKTDRKLAKRLIILFTFLTSLGIALGWILSESSELLEAIFQSLCCGTFTYISISEIMAEEFNDKRYKYQKFLLFILGILIMIATYFAENVDF